MSSALERTLHTSYTESQKAFVERICDGYQRDEAVRLAGYETNNPESIAHALLQTPHIIAAVHIGIAKRLAVSAPVSLKLLQRCVEDERVDMRLRVACAKDLLNRAGFVAPKAAAPGRAGETPLNEMSMDALRTLADKLESEIAGRAKEVSSANAAPSDAQSVDDII